MTLLTLNQAAKAAKKAKSTLLNAIDSKRLMAFKNSNNQWQIDPADLFMVYPNTVQEPNDRTEQNYKNQNEKTTLQQQIERLEQKVNDIKNELDNLQNRFNTEAEEQCKLTTSMKKVIDNQVLPISIIFSLTPLQYNNFTILLKGIDVIDGHYDGYDHGSPHKASHTSISDDLFKIGCN
jgi:hypothetical protein